MEEKFKPPAPVYSPDTPIENRAREAFQDVEVDNEEDLDKIITNVFNEICGNHGKQEFFSYVLPAIKEIYGTNFRKAGLRLLKIIDDGAAQKAELIGKYFKTVIAKQELEYSKKPKQEILQELIGKINDLILEKRTEYGPEYKGIIAVIIHGSFARGNFQINSDLDALFISESEEEKHYFENRQEYIDYQNNFLYSLDQTVRPRVDLFWESAVYVNDEESFFALTKNELLLGDDPYIVVSPYPEIKAKIEALLELGKTQR